ncbi:choline transporter-like protein 1 isoform X2 [Centruroides vittatus]|uniref:choline transporter-like protein 1 isoform X2 n=1 Tax=Centruroides vittatus TaxID=120091 RepID=UPI00350EC0E6
MGCCGTAVRIHAKNDISLNGRYVPTDVEQFDGPIKERKCQDVVFLIIFIVLLTFVVFHYLKIPENDLIRFLYGIDDNGNICGIKNQKFENISSSGRDMTDKKYFMSCDRRHYICQIPSKCVDGCPPDYSRTVFFWCRPNYEFTLGKRMLKQTSNFLWESIEDIIECRSDIIFLCIVAFFLNFIILLFLHYFAGLIIWIIIGIVGLGLLLLSLSLWLIWRDKYFQSENAESPQQDSNSHYYYIGAIIFSVALVIYVLVVFGMRKRIHLVAMLFEEAGRAVKSMPMLLFQPFWSMMFYFSVMFLWLLQCVISCQDVVIAGAVAEWYFSRDKTRLTAPIIKSIGHLVSYHLGSVILGSFIIAIIKLIRIILIQAEKRTKNKHDQSTLKCCGCCFKCLQKFLIYLNKNAFIEIAIFGHGFCKSAQQAFSILTRNALRVAAINSIGNFVLFISKCAVMIVVCIIGLELLKNKNDLNNALIPLFTACVLVYIISTCFMSLYEMVIDTLFICFCEDCERNDGINRPYFMSKSLMVFVEKSKGSVDIPQFYQKELGA